MKNEHVDSKSTHSFSARDLRSGLARVGMRLSPRRRVAAILPLICALVAVFVVPSFAADFTLDGSVKDGALDAGVGRVPGSPVLLISNVKNASGPVLTNAGTIILHPAGGTGTLLAYCISIATERNVAATYQDGPRTLDKVAYILNSKAYYPTNVADRGGAGGTRDLEAAAIQIAIWSLTDGISISRDVNAQAGFPSSSLGWLKSRAQAIRADADAKGPAWITEQQTEPSVVVSASAPPPGLPGSSTITATVKSGTSVALPDTTPVTFTVASGHGLIGGQKTAAGHLKNGVATVTVTDSEVGSDTVQVTVTTNNLAYKALIAKNGTPSQTLILAAQTPVTGKGEATVAFTGTPKLGFTKVVADGTSSGSTVTAAAGDTVTYTMLYHNTGTAPTADAVVTDDLSQDALSQIDIATVKPSTGGTVSGRTISWDVGTVAAGKSGTVSFTSTLPTAITTTTRFCNVATLTIGGGTPVQSNGGQAVCATVTPVPPPGKPGLKIVKSVDATTANLGQELSYTLKVTNTGDVDLTNFTVTDVLGGNDASGKPDNLDMLTAVKVNEGGQWNGDPKVRTITWTIKHLAQKATTAVSFSGNVPTTGLPHDADTCFTNMASATGGNSGGPYSSNSVTSCVHPAACTTPVPTLLMTGPTMFTAGDTADTYTLNASNTGEAPIFPATVTVQIPPGFQVNQPTTPQSVVNGNTVTFTLLSMAPKASDAMTISVSVPSTQASGAAPASAVLDAQDAGTIPDCGHPKVSVSATTEGNVTAGQVQAVNQGPVAVSVPVDTAPTPSTGAGGRRLLVPGIVGLMLIISGLIVITGLRRNPHSVS